MDDYNDYGGAVLAAYVGTIIVFLIIAVAAYIISSIFYNKLFEKAGVEGKWRGWVPIYRELIFAKLGDVSPWAVLIGYGATLLLSWIPVLGQLIGVATFALLVLAAYRVGQKLQKEGAWVVLYIFLSIVWLGIVAYDKSRWQPVIGPAPWASSFLGDKTVWAGVPVQPSAAGTAVRDTFAPPPDWTPGYAPPAPGSTPPPPAGYTPPPPSGYTPPPSPGATPPPPPPSGGTPPPPTTQPPPPDAPRV